MLYAIIAVVVLILDQWLKYWVTVNITLGTGDMPLIGGIIKLVNVHNDGAAFGLFGDVPYMKWVFIGLTVVLSVAIVVLLAKKVFHGKFASLCLVLILSGAVGNCIDRLIHGYVVDMFKLEFVNFAVFNVADAVLVVSALLFIIYLFVSGNGDESEDKPKARAKDKSKPKSKKRREDDESEDNDVVTASVGGHDEELPEEPTPIAKEEDPFWDAFRASLREDEDKEKDAKPYSKKQPAKKPTEPKLDMKAVKEAAKPAKAEAPEFKMPPKEEPETYSLEDILNEFK